MSIADEIPFDIPDSWEWARLVTVCAEIGDIDHNMPKSYADEGGIPFLSAKDILDNNELNFSHNVKHISYEDFVRLGKKMTPKRNDIIFSRIGTLGKVGIVKTDSDFLVSYSCCIIRSIAIEIDYLKYYLMGPIIQDHIKSAKTGIGVPDLGMNEIKKCLIPIPPINEQKRIVQELFKFGPLIDEYSIKWDALEKMNTSFPEHLKKSILQMAVQGKLVPQDPNDEPASVLLEQIRAEKESLIREGKIKRDKNESVIFRRDNSHYEKRDGVEVCIDGDIPYDIPDSWGWVRLNNICRIVNGFTPLRSNPDYWDNGTIPWFTVDDIHSQGRRIHKTAQKITSKALGKDSNRILPPQTVLLCCTASVGEYAISEIALTTNQQFNGLVINDVWKDIYDPEFLLILVQTFKDRLLTVAGKTTFNFVSVKKLGDLVVPVLSLQEQMRIIEAVNNALPIVDAL